MFFLHVFHHVNQKISPNQHVPTFQWLLCQGQAAPARVQLYVWRLCGGLDLVGLPLPRAGRWRCQAMVTLMGKGATFLVKWWRNHGETMVKWWVNGGKWWWNDVNGHDSGTDWGRRYRFHIFLAYFSGLCKGISLENMALYGTVPPF